MRYQQMERGNLTFDEFMQYSAMDIDLSYQVGEYCKWEKVSKCLLEYWDAWVNSNTKLAIGPAIVALYYIREAVRWYGM